MAEYVQVPVSRPTREQISDRLIERLRNSGGWPIDEVWQRWQNLFTEYDRDIALFSQPTPSTEPVFCNQCGAGVESIEHYDRCVVNPTPPRIDYMAPGTRFVAPLRDGGSGDRWWMVTEHGLASSDGAAGISARVIDPSTIRDVQPPARREED